MKKLSQDTKDILVFSGVPVLAFLLYFFSGIFLSNTLGKYLSSNVLSTGVLEVLTMIVGFYFFNKLYIKKNKQFKYDDPFVGYENDEKYEFGGFSPIAFFVIVLFFVGLYYITQSAAAVFPKFIKGTLSTAYMDMNEQDAFYYIAFSVLLAPFAEEVVFRGFLYMWFRERLNPIVCVFLSSVPFIFIHGTPAHIPVTFGLTVFLCVILEITRKLRYSIGFHMLYNFIAMTYLLPLRMDSFHAIMAFVMLIIILFMALAFVPYMTRFLDKKKVGTVEGYINKKRKDIVNKYNGNK